MPKRSMSYLQEASARLDPTRYSRTQGTERYYLIDQPDVDSPELMTSLEVGSITLGLKNDNTSARVGCCCAECLAGTIRQDGGGTVSAPDLVPGNVGSTATVAVGGSVNVSIDTLGDRDYYRVTLTAGVTYTIQTSSDGMGTDAYLNVRDATGATILAFDDDSGDGVNSLLTFTPTSSGVYFIDAGNYNNETIGSYHLIVAAAMPALHYH